MSLGIYKPAAKAAIGFAKGAAEDAFTAMRGGGGHAMRHLQEAGIISDTGSLVARVEEFKKIGAPILENPMRTFDWKLGATETKAFAGQVNQQWTVFFVAKEGPYQGQVIGAAVPRGNQAKTWGLE
jgi:hypothetical protein